MSISTDNAVAPAPGAGPAIITVSPFIDPTVKFELPVESLKLCPFVRDVVVGDTAMDGASAGTSDAAAAVNETVLVPCTTVEALCLAMEYVVLAHANAALPMLTIHRPMETWDMTDALIPAWASDFAERVPLDRARDLATTATGLRMPMLFHLMASRVASDVFLVGDHLENFGEDEPAFANHVEKREAYERLLADNPWGQDLIATPFEDPDSTPAEIAAAKAVMAPIPVADPETRIFTPRRPTPAMTEPELKQLAKKLKAVASGGELPRERQVVTDEFALAVAVMLG
jgi:hypothetical protein